MYRNIGDSVGWTQLAQMFRLTQLAVQCAGLGSAVAGQIQKFTMRYFQDRYATWIVEQGGWVCLKNLCSVNLKKVKLQNLTKLL